MQPTIVAINFRSKPIVTTIEKHEPIKPGVELAIIFCILLLPTKSMEIYVMVDSTRIEALEEHVIPKPIPLVILEIGISAEVTLINSITHAFKVFGVNT